MVEGIDSSGGSSFNKAGSKKAALAALPACARTNIMAACPQRS